MDRLYRYFLWLIKQGYQLFDAIARAATKFIDIPSKEMYNVAVSAFASRAAGQWLSENPNTPLSQLLRNTQPGKLEFNRLYNYNDLLSLFPKLVGEPYQFVGSSYVESSTTNDYRTFTTYIGDTEYYTKIVEAAGMLWEYKYKLVDGRLVFVSKFIVGRPILVDY